MKSQFLLVVLMLVCCCGVVLSETQQQNQNTKVGREVKDDGTNTYGDCTPHIHVRAGPYNMHPDGKTKKDDDGYASDFNPMQMKSLYNMPDNLSAGAGSVIAIIDAYAHANAESDLNVFASEYGLPACTTANGCFKRVNQAGGTTYTTATSSGWNQEVSLDLQWAHAIAPGAKKILVEANSASMGDLMAAVQYASTVADYVSMSFGASETNYKGYESVFQTPGVSYFASTGDNGEAVNYPGVSPNVIAVGGTTLYVDDATQAFADERGWSGSGGGCSLYFQATTLQKPFSDTVCPPGQRGVPDVSYNADPDSGVAIYVSDDCTTAPNCWYSVGGTSLAAPMMAARAAVNGSIVDATFVYGNNLIYRDIITGDNGYNCSVGYDLVTGLGSWINDVGATPFTTTTTGSSTTGASTTTGSNQGSTPTPIGKSDTTFSTNTPFVASANSVHFSFSLLIIAVLAVLSIL